ncbi:MAG: protein translocase subunit SecF [Alphaproteobacteria bacterium]|nr:protein translocase subunit SecF [Alphaproteobacteria bacterium]
MRFLRFRLAPDNTKFGFMKFRYFTYPFSAALSILSVVLFLTMGLNYGIDFAGGTMMELRAKQGTANLGELRQLGDKYNLGEVEVQAFGGDRDVTLRIRLQPGGDDAQQAVVRKVQADIGGKYETRRVEVVGPRISGELVQAGTLGVVLSIVAVLAYLWFRYEWQLAVAAVIATMHDLLLTMGFFALTQIEFNITSIAAILTIVGVSLNETVIVLDRIRETLRKYRRMPIDEVIDTSVNSVIARTIMTSTTTIMALMSLVLFGGHVIQSFSLAMMFGICAGVYSSIFVCAPVLIYLGLRSGAESSVGEEPAQAKN